MRSLIASNAEAVQRRAIRAPHQCLTRPVGTYNSQEARLGSEHPYTVESLEQLVNLYECRGRPEGAKKWRVKLIGTRDPSRDTSETDEE